jgi:hypothetical protein
MNTYFWFRWAELDQLVRQLSILHTPFMRKIADAPPGAVHAIALYLRTTPWGIFCAGPDEEDAANLHDANRMQILRAPENASSLIDLALQVHDMEYEDMLAIAIEAPPKGLFSVLSRCGEIINTRAFYRDLIAAMRHPGVAKMLSQWGGRIDHEVVDQIVPLEPLDPIIQDAYCSRKLMGNKAPAMNRLLQIVRQFHGNKYDHVFKETLGEWFDPDSLACTLFLLDRLPGAPPPWAGDNVLVPVTQPRQLSKVALKYRNCLGNFSLEFVIGRLAFYEYLNPSEPAVLALRNEPTFGWELLEIKGVSNATVLASTQNDILKRISAAGFSTSFPVFHMMHLLD